MQKPMYGSTTRLTAARQAVSQIGPAPDRLGAGPALDQ